MISSRTPSFAEIEFILARLSKRHAAENGDIRACDLTTPMLLLEHHGEPAGLFCLRPMPGERRFLVSTFITAAYAADAVAVRHDLLAVRDQLAASFPGIQLVAETAFRGRAIAAWFASLGMHPLNSLGSYSWCADV